MTDFPLYELSVTEPLFRVHNASHGPWWFAPGLHARFDLPDPRGTCHLGQYEDGAFIEYFHGPIEMRMPIPIEEVSRLFVPRPLELADCCDPRALSFGVTSEIHSTMDRNLTHAWALALASAGFDGVRYLLRVDPSHRRHGYALFGDIGARSWPVASTTQLDQAFIRRIIRTFNIQIY